MAPMVHGLEAQYSGRVDFFFLDADDPVTEHFQKQFGFQYQPYFVLLNAQGQEVKRWAGAVTQEEFEAAFARVIE
jgi:thioredoxin-like negative regulator of GroEL